MREFFDVAIVGGSVVGGVAAAECARRGLKTVILEEDPIVGKYRRCSSICSIGGLRSTLVPFEDTVINSVYGAVVHSPNSSFVIRTREKKASVFDRQMLDESSIARAQSFGAEVRTGSRVTKFSNHRLTTNSTSVTTHTIIGADGTASSTAAAFNFPSVREYAYCYEAEITNVDVAHPDLAEVFFDNDRIPGFFGWIVPVDERTSRVGFGVTDPSALLSSKKHFFSLKEVSPYKSGRKKRQFNAAIPLGPRSVTQKRNVILVGDAAGQTKATTGGGIIFGSLCAQVAGESIDRHLSDDKELDYEQRWRRKYGLTLALHSRIRRAANYLENKGLDALVRLNSNPISAKLMSTFGDMDFIFRI